MSSLIETAMSVFSSNKPEHTINGYWVRGKNVILYAPIKDEDVRTASFFIIGSDGSIKPTNPMESGLHPKDMTKI